PGVFRFGRPRRPPPRRLPRAETSDGSARYVYEGDFCGGEPLEVLMSKLLTTVSAIGLATAIALPAMMAVPTAADARTYRHPYYRHHYVHGYYGPRYGYYAPYNAYAYDPGYGYGYGPYYGGPGISVGIGPFGLAIGAGY